MNNYFIAGSNVIKFWIPDSPVNPKDLDVFYIKGTKKPELMSNLKVEYHEIPETVFNKFKTESNYLTLQSLLILKLSHAEYDIHWNKTMSHIQLLKKILLVNSYLELDNEYIDLFNSLKTFWKTVHKGKEKIKLNVSKKDFFNTKVKRKYDHDFLHESVKYREEPLYKKCLKDGQEVLLDEKKFNLLSYEDKLNLCREEIYAIALERYLIPNNFGACEHESYRKAYKDLVTRMTKGWFNMFLIDNYNNLYKMDINYLNLFKNKIKKHA